MLGVLIHSPFHYKDSRLSAKAISSHVQIHLNRDWSYVRLKRPTVAGYGYLSKDNYCLRFGPESPSLFQDCQSPYVFLKLQSALANGSAPLPGKACSSSCVLPHRSMRLLYSTSAARSQVWIPVF